MIDDRNDNARSFNTTNEANIYATTFTLCNSLIGGKIQNVLPVGTCTTAPCHVLPSFTLACGVRGGIHVKVPQHHPSSTYILLLHVHFSLFSFLQTYCYNLQPS